MSTTLTVKHLSVLFTQPETTLTAVDNINFTLHAGKTLVLLGESGCGKSITAAALMRLLPVNASYGIKSQIYSGDDDLLDLPEQLMRALRGRRMSMVFQEPMTALNPVLTIGEQLREILQTHQYLTRKQCYAQMIALLKEVELPQPELYLRQYPHQLSGGQKQRVVIAMALANHPEVLIADEPTTALDVTIQAQILALLQKLQQQYQMSLLLITHDLGVVKLMADDVCVMYAGQIVEMASVAQFFAQPLHPYVQKMLVTLPTLTHRQEQLQVIAGHVPQLDALPSGCRFHPRCVHVFAPCARIKPMLQTIDKRFVRCHLYPEHDVPPPLPAPKTMHQFKKELHTPDKIIHVEHLAVYFRLRENWLKYSLRKAVDDVSFNLYQGRTLALVGESGCGKTTLARVLVGLIPATNGQVLYRDKPVSTLHGSAWRTYRKNVQIVFQDPFSSLNPRMTIAEILAEGMLAQGLRESIIRQKLHKLIDQVNLPTNCLGRYPHQFSGGQRQRICIARALATEPEILICDEPTSALDVSVQAQILNLLKTLQAELGLAYLFITHNMGVVSYIADEVMVMRQGRVVEHSACLDIFTRPQHEYTQRLLQGVLA